MNTSNERRIYPPKEFANFLTKLVEESPIFETKQKTLMFAAALGAHRGEREKLAVRGEGIRIDIFQRVVDDTFIDALAVAVTNDLHVLAADRVDERITIFEESAAAGLKEMQKLFDRPTDCLEELLGITQSARLPRKDDFPGLDPAALAQLENF